MVDSHLAYIRSDLMTSYLTSTSQTLVWFVWGERNVSHEFAEEAREQLQNSDARFRNIHRTHRIWDLHSSVADE